MAESLIAVDGFLRTLPDGSLVTDANGAPCCCGGGGPSGCCVCDDRNALPDDLCYSSPPPAVQCNKHAKCCCGSKVRLTATAASSYDYYEYFVQDKSQFYHSTYTFLWKFVGDIEVYTDQYGDCKWRCACVSATWERHKLTIDHKGVVKHKEDDSLKGCGVAPDGCGSVWKQFPQWICRPEPVTLLKGVGKLFQGFTAPILDDGGKDLIGLFTVACAGQVVKHKPNGTQMGFTNYAASAKCKSFDATVHTERFVLDFDSSPSGIWDDSLSFRVVTLVDNCCPPGVTSAFQPSGPVNPTIPSIPGQPNPGVQAGGCGGCGGDGGAEIGEAL